MLNLYKILVYLLTPFLWALLFVRKIKGKEDTARIKERRGIPSLPCPQGHLIWIHAASVGEAQSALILINRIQKISGNIHFLVTSGTVTSATLMAARLPAKAFHQYVPLDHCSWVNRFLDHWQPDFVLWMESELWPATLDNLKRRNIPLLLINARLSDTSFIRWKIIQPVAKKILNCFNLIITQTEKDAERYNALGASKVIATDNIKYSAATLPHDAADLEQLQHDLKDRPIWLYASTHEGEEAIACRIHDALKHAFPNLLTILVPRHPERRDALKMLHPNIVFRGTEKNLPTDTTEIYIADTLGELGLFYRLSPIAMIGRSFSNDGGGGHNPIEAAQLNCAVITGANIQYQSAIFQALHDQDAVLQVHTEAAFQETLTTLIKDNTLREQYQTRAFNFAQSKNKAVDDVIEQIKPFLPMGGSHD